MYFCGPPHSGKTEKLVEKYLELLAKGIDSESILVLCSNAYRKQDFFQRVKAKIHGGYPTFNIFTYNGVVYNTVKTYWPLVEEHLKGNAQILPHLTGLESSEFLIKDCIKHQNDSDIIDLTFEDFMKHRSLITELIRRYRLMTENMLSFDELLKRSIAVDQNFSVPANECLKRLKILTSKLRVLDFVSQVNAFNLLLGKKEVKDNFSKIKYLLVDDADETIPACQHFIKLMIPQVKEFYLTYDKDGGTRRGYLAAYPAGIKELKSIKKADLVELQPKASLTKLAEKLFNSIKEEQPINLNNITLNTEVNRIDMLDNLCEKLDYLLIENKTSIEEVVIVSPVVDSAIKTVLQDYSKKNNIQVQFLTGSNKPIDNPKVYGILVLAQLMHTEWDFIPNPFDVRIMLTAVLNFPPLIADIISDEYEKTYRKNPVLPNKLFTEFSKEFNNKYQGLVNTIEKFKDKKEKENIPLYELLVSIFSELIAPNLSEDEPVEDFNKILDSLKDFTVLKNKIEANTEDSISERDWFLQVKNEHVAENPVTPAGLLPGTLVVATPQKVVDIELVSKYQIWLDISSTDWTRTQTARLYNAWAYSNYYNGSEYNDDLFTNRITAHVLRSIVYQCTKEIFALASNIDSNGYEQRGWLINYISRTKPNIKPRETFTLRDDQKQIIEYHSGTMAVAAVPGSGKTFVNVALITKLIEDGISPDKILVLTYMESAAQTLIKRIKSVFPDLNVLPQISTIHGLAFKIVKDGDNLSKLGLNDDLDVADETIKPEIIRIVAAKTVNDFEDLTNWEKWIESGISKAKSYNIKPADIANYRLLERGSELHRFYKPYKLYENELRRRGLVDFDDQITYAIKLLERHPQIREEYQNKFRYIIEDEAQDSTVLQQMLLKLLLNKDKNYIRTGDINQAITTTFAPVDVEGFRRFIDEANIKVEMDKSQRCSEPIYSLANELLDFSYSVEELKNSFYKIKMKPANGNNPNIKELPFKKIFETSEEEKVFAAREIAKLKQKMPQATYAVLLRTNFEVLEWTAYLDSMGHNCICFTDSLKQQKVFNIVHCYLKVIHKPYNNYNIKDLYDALVSEGYLESNSESDDFINSLGSPFISFKVSELPTSELVQFYFDILYWLESSNLPPSELILKLAGELFADPIDRSNVYMLSILAEKLRKEASNQRFRRDFEKNSDIKTAKISFGLPDLISEFNRLASMKKVKGARFLEKEQEDKTRGGFVQLMTIHKAKGMGFDVVFIPHLWEGRFSYPTEEDSVVVDDKSRLEMQILQLAGKSMTPEQQESKIKQNQVEETLRLIYVAITRAKKYLYLTSSKKKQNKYGKTYIQKPSRILEHFISLDNRKINNLHREK